MAVQEADIISHLIEIEQNANALIDEAKIDSDKKISIARADADSKFKVQFEKIVAEHENDFSVKTAEISKKYSDAISEYKANVTSSVKDTVAFNSYLDKILFAE